MRRPMACAFWKLEDLLLGGRLGGGMRGAGEDRAVAADAGEHDGEADGGEHEEDCGVGGELGEEVRCATRTEGCLRTLAAKGSSQVGGFTLLQENYADDEERDDYMQDNEKIDHRSSLTS
jgi:hypothetical protein